LRACRDSCPLSSSLEFPSLELLELLELLEQLELSDARPVWFFKSTESAIAASSGSLFFNTLYHFRDNLGRPLTVLCHTTGKFVRLQKFWVTAIVVSKLRTTCHHPPGTYTVSPGP